MNEKQRLVRLQAHRDQAWAGLRDHLVAIDRIAEQGPQPDDIDLVRMVFCAVAGDLYMQKYLVESGER